MANAVIFYVSAYIAFSVTKFITEVIETQLYCDTYFEISDSLYHVFISSLLARALLITLNLYSYLNGQNVVLFYSMFNLFEKATLFCTIFIKCFLLSGHSLSDGCLIIETTVNAMMIPPVDIVLGFKG